MVSNSGILVITHFVEIRLIFHLTQKLKIALKMQITSCLLINLSNIPLRINTETDVKLFHNSMPSELIHRNYAEISGARVHQITSATWWWYHLHKHCYNINIVTIYINIVCTSFFAEGSIQNHPITENMFLNNGTYSRKSLECNVFISEVCGQYFGFPPSWCWGWKWVRSS